MIQSAGPQSSSTSISHSSSATPESVPSSSGSTDCKHLPGAEDVLVVLKTGASEAREKLLVHFDTTFRCTPHFVVFSNVDEVIEGHHVRDVLSDIPEDIQDDNPEFDLYRKLNEHAQQGSHNFSDVLHKEQGAKEDNPAWKLDKWKFLPLLDKAQETMPDAKWYVFVEADTALVWPNLLQWLAKFDPQHPYYLGGQAFFGDDEFAHGGAGYILSRRALEMATEFLRDDPLRYRRVSEDCCGDLILAKVLKQLDIRVLRSWPSIQGETPSSLDYTERHWCYPVVSYHHMNSKEIESLWEFQRDWISNETHSSSDHPILHRDAFEYFVEPWISHRNGWDNLSKDRAITAEDENLSEDEEKAHRDAGACHALCISMSECVQYSYSPGTCNIGNVIRLGKEESAYPELISGWIEERVHQFKREMEPCTPKWITSN